MSTVNERTIQDHLEYEYAILNAAKAAKPLRRLGFLVTFWPMQKVTIKLQQQKHPLIDQKILIQGNITFKL